MDWLAVTALCALFTLIGAVGNHVYQRGRNDSKMATRLAAVETLSAAALAKLEIFATQLHHHQLEDAAAFAELRATISNNSTLVVSAENRIARAIEDFSASISGMRRDFNDAIKGVTERIDHVLQTRGS